MVVPTYSCVILSNWAELLPRWQVWKRQRVRILSGRNHRRQMNWEVFGMLIKWWTMKSIIEREEMKARGWSWTRRKWKDRWNEWTSWQGWWTVIFRTNMEVEVRGRDARLYYLRRQSNSWWWGFRYDQSWIGAEIKGSGMNKSRNWASRSLNDLSDV